MFMRLANALNRLRICAGWSEPLLVAQATLLEISCRGSFSLARVMTINVSSDLKIHGVDQKCGSSLGAC